MRRRLFAVVSAVSLLCCLATVGLWVRSEFVHESIVWTSPVLPPPSAWREGRVDSSAGRLGITWDRQASPANLLSTTDRELWFQQWQQMSPRAGFYYESGARRFRYDTLLGFWVQWGYGGGVDLPLRRLSNGRWIRYGSDRWTCYVATPYWFPTAIFVAPSAWWIFLALRQKRKRNRRANNMCVRCGYFLTGNTSGTCPECGNPVPKAPDDESPRPA